MVDKRVRLLQISEVYFIYMLLYATVSHTTGSYQPLFLNDTSIILDRFLLILPYAFHLTYVLLPFRCDSENLNIINQ